MNTCLICFKEYNNHSFASFIYKPCICIDCFLKLKRKIKKQKILNVDVISYFPYHDEIISLLYQLKGCNDISIAKVFLSYDNINIHFKYLNYFLIPVPSYKKRDEIRGFNHVEEIFKSVNLPFIKCLYKTIDYKQSSLHKKQREKYAKYIDIIDGDKIKNKNILLIDDVITTGSTIKRCIELLLKYNPKKIKVITICYGTKR